MSAATFYISEDNTVAEILFSPIRRGSEVGSTYRRQVPNIRAATQDQAGHIVGAQLGEVGQT